MSSEQSPNGLTRAVEQHELDSGVEIDDEPEAEQIHIVVTNYDGDPHPHVEGVFADDEEDEADELMKDCAKVTSPPHPIAWQKITKEAP